MKTNKFFNFFLAFGIIPMQATLAQEKPNIVIIITDQQFADAMSCVIGDEHLSTPNMDLLAEKGVRFTKSYSPNRFVSTRNSSIYQ